jgi:hypothetical protein
VSRDIREASERERDRERERESQRERERRGEGGGREREQRQCLWREIRDVCDTEVCSSGVSICTFVIVSK